MNNHVYFFFTECILKLKDENITEANTATLQKKKEVVQ